MQILFIRHTQAVESSGVLGDGARALTADGRRRARTVGEALAKDGVRAAAIWTSPLVRAVQTAELIAVALGFDGALVVDDRLMPARNPRALVEEALADRLDAGPDAAPLLLVGHEPHGSGLVATLLGRRTFPPLPKGGVVALDWPGPDAPGRFGWMLVPKTLRFVRDEGELP